MESVGPRSSRSWPVMDWSDRTGGAGAVTPWGVRPARSAWGRFCTRPRALTSSRTAPLAIMPVAGTRTPVCCMACGGRQLLCSRQRSNASAWPTWHGKGTRPPGLQPSQQAVALTGAPWETGTRGGTAGRLAGVGRNLPDMDV